MPKESRVKTKEERIRSERNRLNKQYRSLPAARKALAAGLVERAAFMRIELDDLEADLRANGWTEKFQQSPNCDPYDRARPQGQTFQSMSANYLKIIKQLDSLLPQETAAATTDDFDNFVDGRDD